MWGTDMTTTFTRQDGQVAVFMAVDHCSAECVGLHAAMHGTRFAALEPIRQDVRTYCGACGQDSAEGLGDFLKRYYHTIPPQIILWLF
jgi:putative transposase